MVFRLFRQTGIILNSPQVRRGPNPSRGQPANSLWRKGAEGWQTRWSGGRRVFYNGNIAYGEQWYPEDDSRAYYFRLSAGDAAIGDSLRVNEVPFDPAAIGRWSLVAGGFQCKRTGETWTRHFDEHDYPFYVSEDGSRREWEPQFEKVPAPDKPRPHSRFEYRSETEHTNTTHRVVRGQSGGRGPANWRQRQSHPRQENYTPRNSNPRNLPASQDANVPAIRYTAPAAPISPTLSYEIGTRLFLTNDWVMLLYQCLLHPKMKKNLHLLSTIKDQWRLEFQLENWMRGGGSSDSVLLKLSSVKFRDYPHLWIPASCVVLPEGYHAGSIHCPEHYCNYSNPDRTAFERHLLTTHKARYKRSNLSGHACHITEFTAHSKAYQELPELLKKHNVLSMLPHTFKNRDELIKKLREERNEELKKMMEEKREMELAKAKEEKDESAEEEKPVTPAEKEAVEEEKPADPEAEKESKKEEPVEKEAKTKKAKGAKAETVEEAEVVGDAEEVKPAKTKGKKAAKADKAEEEKPAKKTRAKKE